MTNVPLRLFLTAAAFAVAGCGGQPLLYADFDEPSICKTVVDVPFEPAVPGVDLKLAFELPVGQYIPLFDNPDAKVTVYLNEVSFLAKSGIDSFDAVQSAAISVLPRDTASQTAQTVLNYAKNTTRLPGTTLAVGGERDIELGPYLSADADKKAKLETVMAGALPTHYWTADVTVCFHMKVHLNYARSIGL